MQTKKSPTLPVRVVEYQNLDCDYDVDERTLRISIPLMPNHSAMDRLVDALRDMDLTSSQVDEILDNLNEIEIANYLRARRRKLR